MNAKENAGANFGEVGELNPETMVMLLEVTPQRHLSTETPLQNGEDDQLRSLFCSRSLLSV